MIKALLSVRLRSLVGRMFFGGKSDGKRQGKGRVILFSILFLYLIAAFAFLSTMMAVLFAEMLVGRGGEWLYHGIFALITFSFVFIFSIFETKSDLFDCSDNDLLLSMPIRPRDIVLSRIFTILVYNYAEAAVIMLPAIIVYGVVAADIVGIFGSIVLFLFIPPLATALASGVGYLLAVVSRRVKNKTLVSVILSALFLGAYFYLYGLFLGNSEAMFENLEESAEALKSSLGFLSTIGEVGLLKPLNTVLFVLISVGVSLLAYATVSANYLKVITDKGGVKRTEYQKRRLTVASPIFAVVKKELSLFFSSATYIMNGAIGLVMTLVLSVAALVKRSDLLSVLEELGAEMQTDLTATLAPTVAVALLLLSSMTMISCSAVSLEGRNLWVIKSMPLSGREVLIAKTLPQLIMSVPVSIISGTLLSIAFGLTIPEGLLVNLVGLLGQIIFAVFGTVINTYLPKFEFENEAQVIKQSMASFLVMMAQMLFSLLIYFAASVLSLLLGSLITLGAMTLILLLVSLLLAVLLLRPAANRFERL
ncbi:MAG: hypothetical protein IJY65_04430 [Clostridia bacterium]|nr:hypothetical protein [Clostridia bacterium]